MFGRPHPGGIFQTMEDKVNNKKIQDFKKGDVVDYHSIIGGPVTSTEHTIQHIGELGHGETVAWLSDKSGCVSLNAISLSNGNKRGQHG